MPLSSGQTAHPLRVLVTGASRGIGRAIASELAARGHAVIATARDPRSLADLDATERLQLDVTDATSARTAVTAAGRIDALVSNAGMTTRGPVETMPLDEVRAVFDLNYFGALTITQAVLPQMRERGSGHLVYVSSQMGRVTAPLMSTYSGSKWALEAMVEALALEVRDFGLRVTSLQPGGVVSPDSAGAAAARVHLGEDDPYAPLLDAVARARGTAITAAEVAAAVAETLDDPEPPLRRALGESAEQVLARHHAAPVDQPFVI
ncbi:SDR family oxidoreductase [Curtobacterium pusillum]|uniref:SDR family oxidoreductase n=1 Tax=Curtobacterium pusillum TaxID=69373 RepID=UPI0011AADF54|nr:SDR family oxidoreductase [Curtobacterium pusillum]